MRSQALRPGKPHFVGDRMVIACYLEQDKAGEAYAAVIQAAKAKWGITSLRGLDTIRIPANERRDPLGQRGYVALSWREVH